MATPREEITLPVGATAEPGTCGSCKYFRREGRFGDQYRSQGGCNIRGFIKDTHSCDLYRNDGKVYIVQRRIPND